tara:strand:- start:52 stop:417 length:366 start_codon:yes stop_codon:yes gene_type:complete
MVCDIEEVGALQMPVGPLVLCIDTRHIDGTGETALLRMNRVMDDGAAEITKGALRLAHQVRNAEIDGGMILVDDIRVCASHSDRCRQDQSYHVHASMVQGNVPPNNVSRGTRGSAAAPKRL